MPRVYQVAELLIRGTIASQTMTKRLKELPPKERANFDTIYENLLASPDLKPVRGRMIRDLRNTIGCEYAEGNDAAIQEFRFCVWKGLVAAMYHCDYSFKCRHCNATQYKSKSGRMSPINKEMAICPACHHVECNGTYYPATTVAHLETQSPIEAIPGAPKYTQEEVAALLADPKALANLAKQYTVGYIHQVLRENKIKYAGSHNEETHFADIAAKKELIGLLDKYNIKHTTTNSSNVIHTDQVLELAPLRFTAEYVALKTKYAQYQVVIDDTATSPITILRIVAPIDTPLITTTVTSYMPVLIVNQPGSGSIDSSGSTDNLAARKYSYAIESRKYTLDGKRRVGLDQSIMRTETAELLEVTRTYLGDGIPKRIFDMITQGEYVPEEEREDWEIFAEANADELTDIMRNGGTAVNNKKVAAILGISPKLVQEIITQMRIIGEMICGYDHGGPEANYD